MKKYKNDLILIIIFILFTIGCFIGRQLFFAETGEYVKISVDGKEEAVLDINTNTEYKVEYDNFINVIVIQNRNVFVSETNCKDQICKNQGKISENGDAIICLPHKVVITITSKEEKAVDAVVGGNEMNEVHF